MPWREGQKRTYGLKQEHLEVPLLLKPAAASATRPVRKKFTSKDRHLPIKKKVIDVFQSGQIVVHGKSVRFEFLTGKS